MAISEMLRIHLAPALKDPAALAELKTILDAASVLSATETAMLDGVTAGAFAASKVMSLNSSGDATAVDGMDIALGTTTGTKIATDAAQKLGFFNATPVVQRTHVADPSGGATQDAESRTAIAAVILRLEQLGLFASA